MSVGVKSWVALIAEVAAEAEVSESVARAALEALVEVASRSLEGEEAVKLHGLCTLRPVWRAPRVLRSLHKRRKMFLDGRWSLTVKAANRLRERLAAKSPQRWREADHQAAWQLAETLVGDLAAYHPSKAPELEATASDEAILVACARAFGPAWRRVARTYDDQVAEDVRAEGSYLAWAAAARWASSGRARRSAGHERAASGASQGERV